LRYANEEKLLFVNNFHSTETFHVEIIIPELAYKLMGHYNVNWEIQHIFTPPTVVCDIRKISNNISLEITPNSTFILKAN
jgi:hypothetical protein